MPSLAELEERYPDRLVRAGYCGINAFIALAIMAVVAWATSEPFLFPSLGPTAFLLFYTPTSASASPRNTLLGHLTGVVFGWIGLAVTGLLDTAPNLEHVTGDRVLAAAIALGCTCAVMPLLRAEHPPAGATTLIVALGLLRTPGQLGVIMLAVVLLSVQGIVINRAAGVHVPLWAAHRGG